MRSGEHDGVVGKWIDHDHLAVDRGKCLVEFEQLFPEEGGRIVDRRWKYHVALGFCHGSFWLKRSTGVAVVLGGAGVVVECAPNVESPISGRSAVEGTTRSMRPSRRTYSGTTDQAAPTAGVRAAGI